MELDHPFGFVAGRWAFATADTADDPDRGPDYVPASGATITFTPETPRHVVPDSPGWTGVINKRVVGKLNEDGRLVDAEGHNHLALGVGTYAVHYFFGNDIKWPSHRIQVTEAHTASNPLWLPPMPAPPDVPGAVNRTIQVPADGEDGQVLVWDGGAFSWDYPPEGPQGPKGDLDAEQLAGAPRLTNELHGITWEAGNATIHSQADGTVAFTATAPNGHIRAVGGSFTAGKVYYFAVDVKATSKLVLAGSTHAPRYYPGSGDWERITGRVTLTGGLSFQVMDTRQSGWDQIEVRNPVRINLTDTFGAGREPTIEYMDAQLARYDHYIGGVDQFAFGDALQALTVGAKQLAGTPRIVNLALGREYATTTYNHIYKNRPIGMTEGDIIYTHRVYSNDEGVNHSVIGSIVILSGDAIHTHLAGAWRPSPTSGSVRSKSRRVKITSPVSEFARIAFYGENPSAPALFSDLNIINLTEVYGAGNEPSLEYMDALVEKHGGYIDGEQYAVGDALQALTVAGPGMTLRHDNSVGERVFLDHPGGSTMIYGDTGWRNITGSLLGDWRGTFYVRRVNDVLYLRTYYLREGTDTPLIILPQGFEPNIGSGYSIGFPSSDTRVLYSPVTRQLSIPVGTHFGAGHHSTSVAMMGGRPWPTTLPGLPD